MNITIENIDMNDKRFKGKTDKQIERILLNERIKYPATITNEEDKRISYKRDIANLAYRERQYQRGYDYEEKQMERDYKKKIAFEEKEAKRRQREMKRQQKILLLQQKEQQKNQRKINKLTK